MIGTLDGAVVQIDFARGERRLGVATSILGGIKAVIEPENCERRRRIDAQGSAWFQFIDLARLDQAHRILSSGSSIRESFRPLMNSPSWAAPGPPEDIAQCGARGKIEFWWFSTRDARRCHDIADLGDRSVRRMLADCGMVQFNCAWRRIGQVLRRYHPTPDDIGFRLNRPENLK
jgi:hypothetical protein